MEISPCAIRQKHATPKKKIKVNTQNVSLFKVHLKFSPFLFDRTVFEIHQWEWSVIFFFFCFFLKWRNYQQFCHYSSSEIKTHKPRMMRPHFAALQKLQAIKKCTHNKTQSKWRNIRISYPCADLKWSLINSAKRYKNTTTRSLYSSIWNFSFLLNI